MSRSMLFFRCALWLIAGLVLMSLTSSAYAAGSGMPWESAIEKIIKSLTGPVAQGVMTAAVIALGFGFAFSEGAFMRRVLGVVLGGAIALAASSILLDLFGFSAGATI